MQMVHIPKLKVKWKFGANVFETECQGAEADLTPTFVFFLALPAAVLQPAGWEVKEG